MDWNREKRNYPDWTEEQEDYYFELENLIYSNKKKLIYIKLSRAISEAICLFHEIMISGFKNFRMHGGTPLDEKMKISIIKNELKSIQESINKIRDVVSRYDLPNYEEIINNVEL